MGSAFLKDFLRDVGGTLWGTGARAAAGGTGGTLGSTFLKDFLRDVGGTLWGTGARAPAGGTGAGGANCRNSLSYPVRTLIKLRLVREKRLKNSPAKKIEK